jgi:UPF0755 protein
MIRLLHFLFYSLSFLFLLVFGWYYWATQPVSQNQQAVEFVISSGESLDSITKRLSSQGLIKSRTAFKVTVFRLDLSKKIQAGYFYLSASKKASEIATQLTRASRKAVRITIPEGLRREEIAKIIDTGFTVDSKKQFDPLEFISLTSNLEGRLFPNTYDFDPQASTAQTVEVLTSEFDRQVASLSIDPSELSRVIVIASLIQREAGNVSEMPLISGVIDNRIKSGWPLQIDATVQYVKSSLSCQKTPLSCTWWPSNITRSDIGLDSPYNTYKYPTIPPRPIANPGFDALKSAAEPVKTDYFFYLHAPNGQIHFSKDLQGHNQNVCQYLKKDCR